MTIPDDATIRQMDGPDLDRLAYDLGLAPEDTALHNNAIQFYDNNNPYMTAWLKIWSPHKNIDQARTLFFDRLPSFGFVVTAIGFGRASAQQYLGTHFVEVFWVTSYVRGNKEPSEAMALIRCACLARAAQRREEAI